MFRKILIANRGEIALRILSACKELGVRTVAVYSEADRNSLHVRFADEAICIGPARSSQSYLNIPQVISAAEIANVDAIHPGYGFLSENANFAEVCEASHITFIGPSPDVIRMMGEKDRARAEMAAAGLPVIPGSPGVVADEEAGQGIRGADRLPADDQGSRRRRRARDARGASQREILRAFQTARSEAEQAFGSPNVYMEKLIERPRHIEFQVLGRQARQRDSSGRAGMLASSAGTRKCSRSRPRRRSTPATGGASAKKVVRGAAKAWAIRAPGRWNFCATHTGELYFIEMNARIQVEHPVTEMVTGVDLVKSQIRMAAGEKLETWSASVRIPRPRDRMPHQRRGSGDVRAIAGRITAFRVPGGPGIRVDTAAYADAVIPPYYDSLVAKLIAHGRDRAEAIARHARRARRIHRRRDQDDDSFAQANPRRSRFHGRQVRYAFSRAAPRRSGEVAGDGCSRFSTRSSIRTSRPRPLSLRNQASRCGRHLDSASRQAPVRAQGLYADRRELGRSSVPRGVRLIVNDRPDIAAMAGASGVHVGQDDLPVEDARKICASPCWVGVSTHNLKQLREAESTSADYIAVGPIFPTATKENPDPVVGLELLRAARRLTSQAAGRHRRRHRWQCRRGVSLRALIPWRYSRLWPQATRSGRTGRARFSGHSRARGHQALLKAQRRMPPQAQTIGAAAESSQAELVQGTWPIRFDDDRRRLDDRLRNLHRFRRHRPPGSKPGSAPRRLARRRRHDFDRRA